MLSINRFFDYDGEEFTGTQEQMAELYNNIENMERDISAEAIRSIKIYTELLLPTLRRMVKEACAGCQINHPSQLQHDMCLMTPFGVFLRVNLRTALSYISPFEVTRIAKNQVAVVQAIDILGENSVWRDNWTLLNEAKLLFTHFNLESY